MEIQTPIIENVRYSRDKNTWEFKMNNVDISIANALRKTLQDETPTLAIEEIVFKENTSALHNEFIGHRFELLPLVCNNISSYNYKDECECQSVCGKCAVILTIDVKNDTNEKMIVTNKSLISESNEVVPYVEKIKIKEKNSSNVTVYEPGITLIHLRPGERLAAKCYAMKGIGKTHTKYSPVTQVICKYDDPDPTKEEGPSSFSFKVCTDGSYSAKQAVTLALEQIKEKLTKFSNKLDFVF